MTIDNIEGRSRLEIAKALPAAMKKAMESYTTFMDTKENLTEADEFKKHHDACKVAIAHIQLLTKLNEWVEAGITQGDDDGGLHEDLIKTIQDSMAEINTYKEKGNDE